MDFKPKPVDNIKQKGIFRGERTLSIMPTFRCNAHCTNCGTLSSPHEMVKLSLDIILTSIQEANQLGFRNIVFTGGEPTLRWEDLIRGVKYAKAVGLATRLVTNGVWAKTPKKALDIVQELRASGLDEINFSTGDEHVRFVPFQNIINGVLASISSGFKPHIMIESKAERNVSKERFISHPDIVNYSSLNKELFIITESPWMPLDPNNISQYTDNIVANRENLSAFLGCDSMLQTFTLLANGDIGACCGLSMRLIPELIVSDVKKPGFLMGAIENAENDFLKVWLRYDGPEKILAWTAEKNPKIKWENMYAHRCQACLRIYKDIEVIKTIRDHYHEKIASIISSAWMEEIFIPKALEPIRKAN